MPLSERIRPNSEAAPWVVDEVRELERKLAETEAELARVRQELEWTEDLARAYRADAERIV